MDKTTQVLSSLNENFFDFAVKQFCGSRIGSSPASPVFRFPLCGGNLQSGLDGGNSE
jgi:hypothetical protein